MDDPRNDGGHIPEDAARRRAEAFLASDRHTRPADHGQKDLPNDEVHDDPTPPPGWVKKEDEL